jgi:hypothetical protein
MKLSPGVVPPVVQQARLEVRQFQRHFQQRIVQQINLFDEKIVGGASVSVNPMEFV